MANGLNSTSWTRVVLFALCLGLVSWLLMQVIHELGHVLAAWMVGGTILHVDLHPLHISETAIRPKPWPEFVVWSGPVVASIVPLLVWGAGRQLRSEWEPCLRFFAGFCLIANGAYLGSAIVAPVGDAFDLVQLGTPRWQLGVFGLVTVPVGIRFWDGLSKKMGIGPQAEPIPWKQVIILAMLLVLIIALELGGHQVFAKGSPHRQV
ncbi:M50 family metallopeptidase [Planctomicrobium sp. SH661]|uniref:M50 family metallopeptidase n=1 Tax=Planctomicrobium sp. SH661 TaxID=3448124 RepID=UPI003F5BBF55